MVLVRCSMMGLLMVLPWCLNGACTVLYVTRELNWSDDAPWSRATRSGYLALLRYVA